MPRFRTVRLFAVRPPQGSVIENFDRKGAKECHSSAGQQAPFSRKKDTFQAFDDVARGPEEDSLSKTRPLLALVTLSSSDLSATPCLRGQMSSVWEGSIILKIFTVRPGLRRKMQQKLNENFYIVTFVLNS